MDRSIQKAGKLRHIIPATVLFLIFSLPAAAGEQTWSFDEAILAAESFLEMVDRGQYEASWEKTAPMFRSQVPEEKWVEQLGNLRPFFGETISREVETSRFAISLPGAPDGEYVVIRFASSFERKKEAVETVTMARAGEKWQVAGYFIK